jgi:hypothetical protein
MRASLQVSQQIYRRSDVRSHSIVSSRSADSRSKVHSYSALVVFNENCRSSNTNAELTTRNNELAIRNKELSTNGAEESNRIAELAKCNAEQSMRIAKLVHATRKEGGRHEVQV